MNILTIFSGRKHNIEILSRYLKKALELNILQEVHFWNNTRNPLDEEYIKSISNLKRTSSKGAGTYILISPLLQNNSFELNVNAKNHIHIKLVDDNNNEYEIGLGGYKNNKSVIRKNNIEFFNIIKPNIDEIDKEITIKIVIENKNLVIFKNNKIFINLQLHEDFEIKNIYFKTGYSSVGEVNYITTQNKGFYFMDTCEKSWKNYYEYYSNDKYKDDIILKCDDDIVFIDVPRLPKFIEFIKNNNYDLVFANTINNGVSAYFQQNKYNLIPKELMECEYPTGGLCGSLWESGEKAEQLHNYFIENYDKFLNYNYNNDTITIDTRFSINFFGYKGKNWHKISNCYKDDEYNLTVNYVRTQKFKNMLYADFYVAHLSFFKQVETGINTMELI
jgi:hypothetical protein